jgi:two-component system, LytTR family, sensor kinase
MTIPWKYSPYIFIFCICIIGSFARAIVLVGFPWYVHVLTFFGQFMTMSAIWQLVGFINRRLEKKFSFETRPGTQISLQVLITLLLLSPVYVVSYLLVKPNFPEFVDSRIIAIMSILLLMVIMVLTFGYYTFELFQKNRAASEEKGRLKLMAAKLEREKTMMQYHHLRNQVNPHFLFNTFSSLDGLIRTDPGLASEFVKHLSKVYRYVLENKENEVVTIQTELNFINDYISLLSIRYQSAIDFEITFSKSGKERGIVMVTLQMLIDNAIKHNVVHPDAPLKLWIWDEDGYFCVRNNKQLRRQIETSNQHGLKQLVQLYDYYSKAPITVSDSAEYFEVKIPLL